MVPPINNVVRREACVDGSRIDRSLPKFSAKCLTTFTYLGCYLSRVDPVDDRTPSGSTQPARPLEKHIPVPRYIARRPTLRVSA